MLYMLSRAKKNSKRFPLVSTGVTSANGTTRCRYLAT